MCAVTWQLGLAALFDPLTIAIALISLFALVRFRANTTLLIAVGVAVGLVAAPRDHEPLLRHRANGSAEVQRPAVGRYEQTGIRARLIQ